MAEYQDKLSDFEALGVSVLAASIDPPRYSQQVIDRGITFPIAHSLTKEVAESVGAWWEGSLGFVEPTGFLIGRGGVILGSVYSSGAVGHIEPDDVIDLIKKRERRENG